MSKAKVGIGEGVGVILFLIGTGMQLFWPDQKGLGLALMVIGGLFALLLFTWVIAQRSALASKATTALPNASPSELKAQAQVNNTNSFEPNFAPVINVHQAQLQTQAQSVTPKASLSPEIECTDFYFVQETLTAHWNSLGGANGRPCRAALADFYLKPIPGADPWIELRTRLEFYGPHGTRLRRVPDGVWKEQGNVIQMPMRTDDTRSLVIALAFDDAGFTTYEYHEEPSNRPRFLRTGQILHHFLRPQLTPLNEDIVRVKVSLTGKYLDEVTLNADFWFSLTRPDMIIKQIQPPEEHDLLEE